MSWVSTNSCSVWMPLWIPRLYIEGWLNLVVHKQWNLNVGKWGFRKEGFHLGWRGHKGTYRKKVIRMYYLHIWNCQWANLCNKKNYQWKRADNLILNSRCHHEEDSDWAGLTPLWSKTMTRLLEYFKKDGLLLWNNPSLHHEHVLLSLVNKKLTGR